MTTQATQFNPDAYKTTTREQWEGAAQAWNDWGGLLKKWLGPATDQMLDMAQVKRGSHVLDVAAGAGEQTLTVAEKVGSNGSVLATDISPSILTFAAKNARDAGYKNVTARELDGEALYQLEPNSFDAVVSRVGLIYFPDQQKALSGMKHVLKPGGKVAAMVYSTPEKNAFFSVPVSIIRRRAQLPPPLPGQPGPFSLGGEGVLEQTFAQAGFKDIEVARANAPVQLKTAHDCLRFEQESFGALHQMLGGLSEGEQQEAWQEIHEALCKFEINGRFEGPCEMLIAVGTK